MRRRDEGALVKVGVRVGRGLAGVAAAIAVAGCDAQPGEDPRTNEPSPSSTVSSMPTAPVATTTSLTPAPQQFDNAAMQDAVHKVLTEYHRVEGLGTVICPPKRPVEKGTSFTCTATIDGKEKKVPIKVTSDDGDYKVGHPR